jgi:hypothetical protein
MPTNNAWNSRNPAQVAKGGTGRATVDAYTVVCGGTTTTNPLQNVVGLGTAGQVLTSNGAAALPSWKNSGVAPASLSSFYAKVGATYTFTTPYVVRYDTALLNTGGHYNPATFTYTAPVKGLYFFYSQIEVEIVPTAAIRDAVLQTNYGVAVDTGNTRAVFASLAPGIQQFTMQVTDTVVMHAGATFQMIFSINSGASVANILSNAGVGDNSFVTGYLITPLP